MNGKNKMYTSIQLLDMAKAACGGLSDYAIAQELNISRSCVSKIRCSKGNFSPEIALQFAELLGLDPLKCIGSVQLEQAIKVNNQKNINLWKQYA